MTNPYDPPGSVNTTPIVARNLRVVAYVLGAFAVVIGWMHLPQFLTSPPAMWGWQNWWFGFAPAAYLLFAAVIAIPCEHFASRYGLISLPVVLSPLLLVTGLILFATYLDFWNIVAGNYSWSQNLYMLLIVSLCPVVWYYLFASASRSWWMLRTKYGG